MRFIVTLGFLAVVMGCHVLGPRVYKQLTDMWLDRLEAEMGDRVNELVPIRRGKPTSLLHVAVQLDFSEVVSWLVARGAGKRKRCSPRGRRPAG